MQRPSSQQLKSSGTDKEERQQKSNETDEEERGEQTENASGVYSCLTDRMIEGTMRDNFSAGFFSSSSSSSNNGGSFQLQPRGNQRPGTCSLAASNRGRKRSGAVLTSGGPASSSAVAPLPSVSFMPTSGLKKSVVSPSDTPITAASSTALKEGRDFPPGNAGVHRNYSQGVRRYLLESPGGVLGGALSNLALQSPRPSPSFGPQTHIFSHQVKSSPFSLSSSGGAAPSQPSSLLSPMANLGAFTSVASPPHTSDGPVAATPSSVRNQKDHSASLYASSFHQETPPAKTAPLKVVTHTPADRKRSPTAADSFYSNANARKSPRDEDGSGGRDQGPFNFMASTPVITHSEIRCIVSSPNVTPFPTIALHPRIFGSNSGALRSSAFGTSPGGMFAPPRARTESTTTPTSSSRSGNTLQMPGSRPLLSLPSGRTMTRPPMHQGVQTLETPRNAKKPSSPMGGDSTSLTKSDVSFIPLPDWDDHDDTNTSIRLHEGPPRTSQPPRVLSLLHTSSRPDPIDIMMSSLQSSHGNIYQHDSSNDSSFLDNESLSDDQDDHGFLLAAPREIEEERRQRNGVSTCVSSASEQHESRPSKHPRHGSRPSNSHSDEEETEEEDDDTVMQEWADHHRPLPHLEPLSTSSCSMTVPTRDLVTPPAMTQSSSPPPLMPHVPEFH